MSRRWFDIHDCAMLGIDQIVHRHCPAKPRRPLGQRRVVGIALFRTTVKSGGIRSGQRRVQEEAFRQIRVADEQRAKCDCIGQAGLQGLFRRLLIITNILHENP